MHILAKLREDATQALFVLQRTSNNAAAASQTTRELKNLNTRQHDRSLLRRKHHKRLAPISRDVEFEFQAYDCCDFDRLEQRHNSLLYVVALSKDRQTAIQYIRFRGSIMFSILAEILRYPTSVTKYTVVCIISRNSVNRTKFTLLRITSSLISYSPSSSSALSSEELFSSSLTIAVFFLLLRNSSYEYSSASSSK